MLMPLRRAFTPAVLILIWLRWLFATLMLDADYCRHATMPLYALLLISRRFDFMALYFSMRHDTILPLTLPFTISLVADAAAPPAALMICRALLLRHATPMPCRFWLSLLLRRYATVTF